MSKGNICSEGSEKIRLVRRKRRGNSRLPVNPNKATTVISAEASWARMREENRRVFYWD